MSYPSSFIDKCIKTFLYKIFCKKVIRSTVPRKKYFIVLPYLVPLSTKTLEMRVPKYHSMGENELKESLFINLTFKTHSSRVSHLLRFKGLIPKDLVSNIIYSYKCPSCNAGDIGETDRHSKVSRGEDLSISCFTGEPVKGMGVKVHLK